MKEIQARNVLLIRAIELCDADAAILPREDRQWASGTARAQAPPDGSLDSGSRVPNAAQQNFLAGRAELLRARLSNRRVELLPFDLLARWPHWLYWALPLAAFLLGALTDEMTAGRRVNILSLPLLTMLAWNALVYLLLILNVLGRLLGMRTRSAALAQLLTRTTRISGSSQTRLPKGSPLHASLARFGRDWLAFSGPQMAQRGACILHLSAALLTAGTLGGMYLRGLGLEYLAGWESTFLNADVLERLLHLVLGPASRLTGIPLATAAELAAIEWSGPHTGENAARWIHLYAATATLFIILPRLLLAAAAAGRAYRLQQRFPLMDQDEPYLRRLLAGPNDASRLVSVTPYSYHPSAAAQQRLHDLLHGALGQAGRIEFAPTVPYGSEQEYLDLLGDTAGDTRNPAALHIVLFSAAATPEHEIHGTLMEEIQRLLTQRKDHSQLLAILDEAPYRQRLAGQAGAAERLAERRRGWQQMLQQHQAQLLALDLGADNDAADSVRAQLQNIVLQQG
ncbi:DUF2868 domain-containing protein [Herminiimonas sp. CN]|uniref:DUF2868 domain-containing protein n=1 Tax=Herminiimonas sp. CN TaxID=1349818 RepID=UPI000473DC71|nr:DUF2868 domain-containing protein [Herminiimonas sp. CN]